jgi:hypothetical protein
MKTGCQARPLYPWISQAGARSWRVRTSVHEQAVTYQPSIRTTSGSPGNYSYDASMHPVHASAMRTAGEGWRATRDLGRKSRTSRRRAPGGGRRQSSGDRHWRSSNGRARAVIDTHRHESFDHTSLRQDPNLAFPDRRGSKLGTLGSIYDLSRYPAGCKLNAEVRTWKCMRDARRGSVGRGTLVGKVGIEWRGCGIRLFRPTSGCAHVIYIAQVLPRATAERATLIDKTGEVKENAKDTTPPAH